LSCIFQQLFVAMGTCLPSRCPATTGGIHIKTHRLMGGIYKVRPSDGLKCHDIHTKFHKDWFRHSKFNRGIHRHTDSMTIAYSYIYFFKIREVS
jgi:hypothetical protein